jgi:hypothetical protein
MTSATASGGGGGGGCSALVECMMEEGDLDSLALTSAVVDGDEQRVLALILGTTTPTRPP